MAPALGVPIINPADESVLGTVPHATRADLDDALDAAVRGFNVRRKTAPNGRAQLFILEGRGVDLPARIEMATAMVLEQGKLLDQAKLETSRGCETTEWDATEGMRMYGRVIPAGPGLQHTVSPADRPCCSILAVEFPGRAHRPQGCRRAGVRPLDHPESIGRNLALRGCSWCARSMMQACPRACSTLVLGDPAEISGYLRRIRRSGLSPSPARCQSANIWPPWPARP